MEPARTSLDPLRGPLGNTPQYSHPVPLIPESEFPLHDAAGPWKGSREPVSFGVAQELAAVRRESTDTAGVRLHLPVRSATASRPPDPEQLTERLLEGALARGCAAAGVFSLEPFTEGGRHLAGWLEAGHHGEMAYLAEGPRHLPAELLPGGRSGLVVALPYGRPPPAPGSEQRSRAASVGGAGDESRPLIGRVAKYAQGDDYHHHLRVLLLELADLCAQELGAPVRARVCVDTAPLLERDAAARAGLSFFGKNTLAIVPGVGSYFLLGELLVDVPLAAGARVQGQRQREIPRAGCGSCTACLDACPTGAFLGPHAIDARRCISYLTIEYDGVIPEDLRAGIGAHVFGCDVCQDVCPFNHSAHKRLQPSSLGHHARLEAPDPIELLELTSSGYRRFVAGTALRRVNRARLARNAAVTLGNVGDERALLPLAKALRDHPSALVRGHAAWALGRLLQRLSSLSKVDTFTADEGARRHLDPTDAARDVAKHTDSTEPTDPSIGSATPAVCSEGPAASTQPADPGDPAASMASAKLTDPAGAPPADLARSVPATELARRILAQAAVADADPWVREEARRAGAHRDPPPGPHRLPLLR